MKTRKEFVAETAAAAKRLQGDRTAEWCIGDAVDLADALEAANAAPWQDAPAQGRDWAREFRGVLVLSNCGGDAFLGGADSGSVFLKAGQLCRDYDAAMKGTL